MIGTVVLNERVYAIERLWLEGGRLKYRFVIGEGEPYEPGDGHYAVFGPDGRLCWEGRLGALRNSTKGAHGVWYVTLDLTMADHMAEGARARIATPEQPRRRWPWWSRRPLI